MGWIHHARVTGSSVSEVDIAIPAGATAVKISGHLTPASDGVQLLGRVTTDGFATVESGASDYSFVVEQAYAIGIGTADAYAGSRATGAINLSGAAITNESYWGHVGDLIVWYPRDSSLPTWVQAQQSSHRQSADNPTNHMSGGIYLSASDIDGIRLLYDSGNVADYDLDVFVLDESVMTVGRPKTTAAPLALDPTVYLMAGLPTETDAPLAATFGAPATVNLGLPATSDAPLSAELNPPYVPARPVRTYDDLSARRYGVDLKLPGPGETVTPTATGDWPLLGGLANLKAAQTRRAITAPRELVHRPEYGGGLVQHLELPATPEALAAKETDVELNALRDPRVQRARAVADSDGDVILRVEARGEDEPVQFQIAS